MLVFDAAPFQLNPKERNPLPLITPKNTMNLPTRKLGRTGIEVTQLGYGSMGIRGPKTWGVRDVSEQDAESILHQVLDSGINFIDTAPDYGLSEERIGRYLGARRSEYFLASKCGCVYTQHDDHLQIEHHWNKEVIERNLEKSLARLQTGHLDLLQFHGGDAETLQREGLIEQLVRFQTQGMIRFLGVSTKLPEMLKLMKLGVFDTFQLPYSALAPEHHDVISEAANNGAGIILRGGIAHGGPDAEIKRPALDDIWERAKLDEVLPASMTRAELILRYTLSHPHCHTAIVGTCNARHLAENIAAAKQGVLPAELLQTIAQRVRDALPSR
ncbi:General stress protein 69 [Novipirellula galeiformis]|uniref:General stress protein 69 n=2 Tax=Novipirellula galeiformis TaxID=2528004 RepID=A0A5C6CJJ6_9BACT|nr:General stress protein 69 [Novipirellula galeiformis]